MTARRASFMILVITFFWGFSFPLNETWHANAGVYFGDKWLATLTLIATRMVFALVVLVASRPQLVRQVQTRELLWGALLGLVCFSGFAPQIWALSQQEVTPALSAFLTSLGSLWVPLVGWLLFRTRFQAVLLVCLGLGFAGAAVLCWNPDEDAAFTFGAWITLGASVLFAVQIVLLDRVGRTLRGEYLTVGFFSAAAIAALVLAVVQAAGGDGLAAWATRFREAHTDANNLLVLGLLILLCTVLSYHWMNLYQPHVSAARAALIYLLEPVFTALVSIPWGLDELSFKLIVGGTLILAANLLAEVQGRH